jgi:hypothetical protein
MFFRHWPARKLRICAMVIPFFMTALLPQGALAAAHASATPTGKLMSAAHEISKYAVLVVIIVAIVALAASFLSAAATGDGNLGALIVPLVVAICLFVFKFDIVHFFDLVFGDVKSDKAARTHPRHVVPHPPTWFEKYWWVVVLAVVGALLLVIVIYFAVKAVHAWHNSPAKVEARERKHNDLLRRIAETLADNPDYPTLLNLRKQIEKRDSEKASAILVRINALLDQSRREAEETALEPVERELDRIQFKIDPADTPIPEDRVIGE